MRRLNIRLLVWLVAAAVPTALGVHLLHRFQVTRHADLLVDRAREKRDLGETDEAARLLSRYMGLRPGDAAASAELATTLLTRLEKTPPSRRDVSRTFAALETAVRNNPADSPLRLSLAEFCVQLGRHADAQQHLEQLASPRAAASDADVTTAAIDLVRARAAIGIGDLPEAVRILATIVGFDPDTKAFVSPGVPSDSAATTALPLLAAVFDARFDDPATADVVMRRLRQVCPDDPRMWTTLARWHLNHDDLEAAAEAAAQGRDRAANDLEVALISFEVAVAQGDLGAADEILSRALAAHPDQERLFRAQALLLIRQGRSREAIAALRAGLARQPDSSPLVAMLAELLLEQGDAAGAREMIDSLIAEAGHDTPIVVLLEGWCLVEQRQWLRAKQVLERLRSQVPENDRLRQRANLLLARCLGPLGAFDEQLSVCQGLLAENADLTAARHGAAAALAALGRPAEALALLDGTQGRLPDETATLRAECLLATGQIDAAVDLLTEAVERQPTDPRLRGTLVEALFRQQGPAGARELLSKTPAPLAKTPPLLIARAVVAAGQAPDDAQRELAAIEAAAETMPADERQFVLAGLARLQAGLGNRDAAGRLWACVRQTHPDDLAASWEVYDLAAVTGDAEATRAPLADIERIAGTASADGRAARAGHLLLRVTAAMPDHDQSWLDEARHLLLEAEAERPYWQRIQLLFAETERLRGDGQAERERLRQALAVGPRHAAGTRRLMALLVSERRFDEAARLAGNVREDVIVATALLGRRPEPAAWQAAVALLESFAPRALLPISQRVQLADLWDRLGRWDECRAELQSLAAAANASPAITALLVGKLIDHDELAAARSWFTKLTRTSADVPGILMLEARLAAASVAQRLTDTADEAPETPATLLRRAAFEAARGNQSQSDSLHRAVLESEQASPEARAVAANNLAFAMAAPATADEAATLVDSAIATLGPQPDLLDTRGLVRLAQGNPTAAVADLEEACLVPSAAKLVHLAAAWRAAGDMERAAATLQRARRLMSTSPRLDSRDQTLLEEVERAVSPALERP